MKCTYCENEETKVLDSRESDDLTTRRRRECLKCGKRFTTYERVENFDLVVVKKNGGREQFNRDKLRIGVLKACEKRPISLEKIEEMIGKIESKLKNRKSSEVKSEVIGEEVIKGLKKLDKVAYIRFASVYRDFADVTDFQKEVKELLKK